MLAAGFGPGRRAAAAARLYLRRWQAAHQELPPPLTRFLLARPSGGAAPAPGSQSALLTDYSRLMAWVLWLRRHGSGPWRAYVDRLPQARRWM